MSNHRPVIASPVKQVSQKQSKTCSSSALPIPVPACIFLHAKVFEMPAGPFQKNLLSYKIPVLCHYKRVAPNNRVLKHQFLKHRLQKDRLFALKHRLSKTSNVKNINCLKHRLKYTKISTSLNINQLKLKNGSWWLNIVNNLLNFD